jgi:uncharacterized membrane protein SpoIIM required for sporulation
MEYFLIIVICAIFCGMLFLNVYFRVKVFQNYKVLVQNRVEFGAAHLFNKEKMESEVISKHPNLRNEIELFVNNIQYSMKMATVLTTLITLFAAVLMYFRE